MTQNRPTRGAVPTPPPPAWTVPQGPAGSSTGQGGRVRGGRNFRRMLVDDLGVLAEDTGRALEVLERLERHGQLVQTEGEAVARVLARQLGDVVDKLDALAVDQDGAGRAFAGMVVTRRVVLNLRSGNAVAGVVVRHDGPLLEVAEVVLLQPGAEAKPVDGRVIVERDTVEFVQVLT